METKLKLFLQTLATLAKLFSTGVRGKKFKTDQVYLTNRHQIVRINGKKKKSSREKITSGVPQGSILGPHSLFFLVFINDLPDYCVNLKTMLFADDAKFISSGQAQEH